MGEIFEAQIPVLAVKVCRLFRKAFELYHDFLPDLAYSARQLIVAGKLGSLTDAFVQMLLPHILAVIAGFPSVFSFLLDS